MAIFTSSLWALHYETHWSGVQHSPCVNYCTLQYLKKITYYGNNIHILKCELNVMSLGNLGYLNKRICIIF